MNLSMTQKASRAPAQVLVVDDEENNRMLLRDRLEAEGYVVREAENGSQALEAVAANPPDVILLDVMMPKLDGFAVCRQLKNGAQTAHIPVLLVTSLSDRKERLAGMEAGANDFLAKPIDLADVLLRVRNNVQTKRLFDQLHQSYEHLKRLEELRDNLTQMIVHDLRSPLTTMIGFLDLAQESVASKIEPEEMRYLEQSQQTARRLAEMITSLLDVSRLEAGQMPLNWSQCDLTVVAKAVIETFGALPKQPRLILAAPERLLWGCDSEIIQRVLMNLVGNAVKCTPSGGEVRICLTADNVRAEVAVVDTGPGIPKEFHKRIFEKFGQVGKERKPYSTGLGLTFCKLAVEAHGGQIGVESEPGRGSRFWFSLPAKGS